MSAYTLRVDVKLSIPEFFDLESEVVPVVRTLFSLGCQEFWQAVEVGLIGRERPKGGMRSDGIVELQVATICSLLSNFQNAQPPFNSIDDRIGNLIRKSRRKL